MSFIETKYTPTALSDYVCDGNVSSILKPYLDHQSKRPLLLYGEPGTGKTQLAKLLPKAVCEDFYEVIRFGSTPGWIAELARSERSRTGSPYTPAIV